MGGEREREGMRYGVIKEARKRVRKIGLNDF